MLHVSTTAFSWACSNAGIADRQRICWLPSLEPNCASYVEHLCSHHARNSRWNQCLVAGLSKAKFVDQYLSQRAGQGAFSQDVVCHVSIGMAALVGMLITMLLAEQNLRLDTKQLMSHSRQNLD